MGRGGGGGGGGGVEEREGGIEEGRGDGREEGGDKGDEEVEGGREGRDVAEKEGRRGGIEGGTVTCSAALHEQKKGEQEKGRGKGVQFKRAHVGKLLN